MALRAFPQGGRLQRPGKAGSAVALVLGRAFINARCFFERKHSHQNGRQRLPDKRQQL